MTRPLTKADMRAFLKHVTYPFTQVDKSSSSKLKSVQKDAEIARANRVGADVRLNMPDKTKYGIPLWIASDDAVSKGRPDVFSNILQHIDQTMTKTKSQATAFSSLMNSMALAGSMSGAGSVSGSYGPPLYETNGSMPSSAYQSMVDRNNALSLAINRENNQFNADQAELQRGWQEQMANTAHQREVADLKAAGLNPVLSAGGSGAVTPSGGMASNASYSNVSGDSVISALATLASSAMSAQAVTNAAGINAAASMYGATTSAEATRYSARQSRLGQEYGADHTQYGSIERWFNNFWNSVDGYVKGTEGLNQRH